MGIEPRNNSIKNLAMPKAGSKGMGISAAIKSTQIAKSTSSTTGSDINNNDGGEVSTEGENGYEPRKAISSEAEVEKARSDTLKALYGSYYDYKKHEIDSQRGMQQDQLAMQRALQEQALNQGQGGNIAGAIGQGIGALTGALGSLKGSGSGGGSSGSCGSCGSKEKELSEEEKKAFEDQKGIVKVDAKGNPITTDSTNGTNQNPGMIANHEYTPMQGEAFSAVNYDNNGFSIESTYSNRGENESSIVFDDQHSEFAQEQNHEITEEQFAHDSADTLQDLDLAEEIEEEIA